MDEPITGGRRVALVGMGGAGKTVLAAQLARDQEVQRSFPGGVYWLGLDEKTLLVRHQAQLASALGGTGQDFTDCVEGRDRLSKLLTERSCLLVLDNVWQSVELDAFDVLGPRGRLLFTTRDVGLAQSYAASVHHIDLLPAEQARKLLANWAGLNTNALPLEAGGVLERCGGLPLAIAMAGAMVRNHPERWPSLLQKLKGASIDRIAARLPGYPHPNLLASLEVSLEDLDTAGQERGLRAALDRYVDLAVFKGLGAVPESALAALWASADVDETMVGDYVALFVDRSLAIQDAEGRLGLHDLQMEHIISRARGQLQAQHTRLVDGYARRRSNGWVSVPDDGYFFGHLAYHLISAARKEELRALLLDFNWLQARLEASDFTDLIADYNFLSEDAVLSLLRDALRLSAHVLAQDKTQLAGQLLGRLLTEDAPEIRKLLEKATHWESVPWLRPLTASLTSPGGLLLRTMTGHTDGITALAVTPDGRYALSGSWDHTLKLWDVTSGRLLHTMVGHTDGIRTLAITPDARRAISSSWDCTIRVWDIKRETELYKLPGCEDNEMENLGEVAISPDGQRAVSVLYNASSTSICVWDLAHGTNLHTLSAHTGGPVWVIIIPDGRRAISGSNDGTLIMWDLNVGKQLRTLRGPTEAVTAVTPDCQCAVSVTHGGTLSVWDLENGAELFTLPSDPKWRKWSGMRVVAVTPDGRRAVSASDDSFILWDIEKKKELRTLIGYTTGVPAVAVMPDGRHIISASQDNTLKLWDLECGVEQRPDHAGEVSAIVVMKDEPRVVSNSYDGTLITWDVESGKKLRELPLTYTNMVDALLSEGRRAVSTWDKNVIVWDVESGDELQVLEGHTDGIKSVEATPDGQQVVSVSNKGDLIVWDLKSGHQLRRLSGQRGVTTLIPGGWRAVSAASKDFNLEVWDMESEEELYMLRGHTYFIHTVAVTPDGRRAVSGSRDMTLKVWDLEKREMIASFTGESTIEACNISRDGLTVVGGEALGRVHFLRLEGG